MFIYLEEMRVFGSFLAIGHGNIKDSSSKIRQKGSIQTDPVAYSSLFKSDLGMFHPAQLELFGSFVLFEGTHVRLNFDHGGFITVRMSHSLLGL